MQREILFRIWDKQNKEMIEDVHICPEYGWLVMSDNDALEERGRYNPKDLVWMQYTGLNDKNGVKIFENDIVTADCLEENYYVKYCDTRYLLVSLDGKREMIMNCYLYQIPLRFEVIGNIFDEEVK